MFPSKILHSFQSLFSSYSFCLGFHIWCLQLIFIMHILLFIFYSALRCFLFPDSFTFSLSPSSRPPMFSLNTLLLLPVILPAYSSPSVYQSVCSSCLYNIYQSWLTHLPSLLLISGRLSCLSYKHSLRAVFKGARNRVIAWIKPWWSQMTVNINGLK